MPKGVKGFLKGYTPHNKGLKGYTNKGTFKQGNLPPLHKKDCNCFRCNPQSGEKNGLWKGDKVRYGGIHMRKRKYNLAKNYDCSMKDETCRGQMCWASKSHKALRNLDDYFPLCNSHNQRYDLPFIMARRKISKRNKSGTTGVFYNQKNKRWIASIRFGGKSNHLGTYKTMEEAILKRKEALDKITQT